MLMPVTPDELHARRLDAARWTRGTSSSTIYEMALSLAEASIDRHADVLEFGAGAGTLLALLDTSGFTGRLVGADILGRPAHLGQHVEWVECDLNGSVPIRNASFGAVIATEVIEHLENARATFRELSRLLKPGGVLILTTPNQESVRSLLSLIIRGHFVDFLDSSYPAHITPLVRTDLRRLCLENGFEPPQFVYSGVGSLPGAPRISWQRISLGLLKGSRFSDNVAMISRKRAS